VVVSKGNAFGRAPQSANCSKRHFFFAKLFFFVPVVSKKKADNFRI